MAKDSGTPPEARPGILHYKDGERFSTQIFVFWRGPGSRFPMEKVPKTYISEENRPRVYPVHVDISQAFFGSCTRVLVCIRPGSDLQIMITGNDFGAGCRTARGIVLRYQLFQSSRREYKHRHIHVASQDVVDHHTS